jgi:hypothetical protein
MPFEKTAFGLLCVMLSLVAVADVPVTFQPGTPASAAEVNQNFTDLDTRLNASLGGIMISSVAASSDTSTGVVSTSCASNQLVVSANCSCDYVNGTRNYGVLFACVVAGNGGIAGCFPEGTLYDPQLPPPEATIEVVCASGVRNDGTPITPTFLSPVSAAPNAGKLEVDSALSKVASDALESALKVAQDQESDFKTKSTGKKR